MSEWPIERTQELRRLGAAGLSASMIAKALGYDVTRNSVVGKAWRMGVKLGSHRANSESQRKSWANPAIRERRTAAIRASFAARKLLAETEAAP